MVPQKISTIKNTDHNEKSVIITKLAKKPRIAKFHWVRVLHLLHNVQLLSCVS